jgi:hypothetical protein
MASDVKFLVSIISIPHATQTSPESWELDSQVFTKEKKGIKNLEIRTFLILQTPTNDSNYAQRVYCEIVIQFNW